MNSSLVLLIRHFFGRFFDNEIVSQSGDMRTNVVQALGLVAVPGMFVSFYMLPQRVRFDQPFALVGSAILNEAVKLLDRGQESRRIQENA